MMNFDYCHYGQHSVRKESIVARNHVGNICAACLNASMAAPAAREDRMVRPDDLAHRGPLQRLPSEKLAKRAAVCARKKASGKA